MTTTPQSMSDLPELPDAIACVAKSEFHPLADFDDTRIWDAKLADDNDTLIYTADQLREYGRLCRATAEQAGKVEGLTMERLERNAITAGECPDQTRVILFSSLLRMIDSKPEPAGPKLIGWRTADYLYETADPAQARNWEGNVGVLPIFEGDQITKLLAKPTQPAASGDAIVAAYVRGANWAWENGKDEAPYLPKAARDYEDKNSPAAPVSPSREVEALVQELSAALHADGWTVLDSGELGPNVTGFLRKVAPVQEKAP